MTMTNAAVNEDHTSSCKPVDPTRVRLNEEHELIFWTERFGISPAALRVIVNSVGSDVDEVTKAVTSGQSGGRGSIGP